jgi:hypothetical protein
LTERTKKKGGATVKIVFSLLVALLISVSRPAEAFVLIDVYRDGYIDDISFNQDVPLDGIPDDVYDTNALLAGRGEFFDEFNNFRFDARAVMTFDVGPYAGRRLQSTELRGFGFATGSAGTPVEGLFYLYEGDGIVGLDDFDVPADFAGNYTFDRASDYTALSRHTFAVDVTAPLQTLLSEDAGYAEFRLEADRPEIYLSAGETREPLFPLDFQDDHIRHGPRLKLVFQETAAVPEPSTFILLSAGLAGCAFRRRKGRAKGQGC